MSLILKSDTKANNNLGMNIFNLPSRFGEYLALMDFATGNYLLKDADGSLNNLSFSEAIDYERTGVAEYYDKRKGWMVAAEGEPAIHYNKQTGVTGLLNEPALKDYEQYINRRGGDVKTTETITIPYSNKYIWLTVRGSGTVTITGDIEARTGTTSATEQSPAFLKMIVGANNTSTVTLNVTGDVEAYLLNRGETPYSGSGIIPYVTKEMYLSKGETKVQLSQTVLNRLNTLSDYTIFLDTSPAMGYPANEGVVLSVGANTGEYISLAMDTVIALRARTLNPTGAIETFGTFVYSRPLVNTPAPISVVNKGQVVTTTNGLDIKSTQIPITINDVVIGFGGKGKVITRLVIYPRAFSDEELRELALAWTTYK